MVALFILATGAFVIHSHLIRTHERGDFRYQRMRAEWLAQEYLEEIMAADPSLFRAGEGELREAGPVPGMETFYRRATLRPREDGAVEVWVEAGRPGADPGTFDRERTAEIHTLLHP